MINSKDALAQSVLKSLQVVEKHMDKENEDLNNQIGQMSIDEVREKRKLFLQNKQKQCQEYLAKGHGTYNYINDAKDFFTICKESKRVVVHFCRGTTKRCEIVDKHLNILCKQHLETKFIKVDVEKYSFLCERLKIVILPSIVVVLDGHTEKTFRGFEEFGNTDDFSTSIIEEKLKEAGAIESLVIDFLKTSVSKVDPEKENKMRIRQSENCRIESDDEDW